MTYPRIVIRHATSGGKDGYTVTMYRRRGEHPSFAPRVFVETKRSAIRCKVRFKMGEKITLEDMTLPDLHVAH